IVGATASVLNIVNVPTNSAGNYTVTITNAYGSVTSSNALLTVNQPSCLTVPSGLVSWWRAEGSAADLVGPNGGTLLNGAGFSSGEVGQCFNLTGANQYIQVP